MAVLKSIPMSHRDKTVGFGKGWYCVAESAEVAAGAMLPVTYFNRELIVFRDKAGEVRVSDAYCPHLGAHLASANGRIENDQIVCPFHGWRFDTATGKCAGIPYTKIIPPQAKLGFYPAAEVSGMIMMWWHEAGGAPEPLPFDVMKAHPDWTWVQTHTDTRETFVPPRDLHENIFDTAHIQQIHGARGVPEIASIVRRPFGLEVNYAKPQNEPMQLELQQFNFSGMGMVSHILIAENRAFAFIQNNTHTPIDSERNEMRIRMYVGDTGVAEVNAQMGKTFADLVMAEIGQDLAILDFKKHLERPLICAGDGPIMKWREYAAELLTA